MSWWADGNFLVFVLQSVHNSIHGFFVNNEWVNMTTLETKIELFSSSELRPLVVACFMAIAGSGAVITFFERNGQRHRRSIIGVVPNSTPKLMRGIPDYRSFSIAAKRMKTNWKVTPGDFTVSLRNYRLYCKKPVVSQHGIIAIC